ncbi:hypothetical protein [Streptomyces sp. NPDC051173]|uniref:hypothetical protein n=1 Tax=Streptomyces sp. NPDC051173 TaxID=3155164 RepID=UPI00344BBB69
MSASRKQSDPYENTPTSMVYEEFAEAESQLSAQYISLHRAATDEAERARLWQKVIGLRDAKRAVPAHDRGQLISHIRIWRAELAGLKAGRG